MLVGIDILYRLVENSHYSLSIYIYGVIYIYIYMLMYV